MEKIVKISLKYQHVSIECFYDDSFFFEYHEHSLLASIDNYFVIRGFNQCNTEFEHQINILVVWFYVQWFSLAKLEIDFSFLCRRLDFIVRAPGIKCQMFNVKQVLKGFWFWKSLLFWFKHHFQDDKFFCCKKKPKIWALTKIKQWKIWREKMWFHLVNNLMCSSLEFHAFFCPKNLNMLECE